MNSGSHMFIANGKVNNPILNMIKNKKYTHFSPKISTLDARKKWIIGSLNYNGTIFIDNGAAKGLTQPILVHTKNSKNKTGKSSAA